LNCFRLYINKAMYVVLLYFIFSYILLHDIRISTLLSTCLRCWETAAEQLFSLIEGRWILFWHKNNIYMFYIVFYIMHVLSLATYDQRLRPPTIVIAHLLRRLPPPHYWPPLAVVFVAIGHHSLSQVVKAS
jgi:hypothetical protein